MQSGIHTGTLESRAAAQAILAAYPKTEVAIVTKLKGLHIQSYLVKELHRLSEVCIPQEGGQESESVNQQNLKQWPTLYIQITD